MAPAGPAPHKTAFLYPCDSYALSSIGQSLHERSYIVTGAVQSHDVPPSWISESYQIGCEDEQIRSKELLSKAQLIVFYMPGNEAATRLAVGKVLHITAASPSVAILTPKASQVTFIGISSPLTWAATLPNLFPSSDIRDTGTEQEADNTFTEEHASQRQPAVCATALWEAEQVVIRAARKPRLNTYIICPGLLYGKGEDDAYFHPMFRAAWQGTKPIRLLGPATNIIPTLHIKDLGEYALAVHTNTPNAQYLLVADNTPTSPLAVAQKLSASLSNVRVEIIPGQFDIVHTDLPVHEHMLLDLHFKTTPIPEFEPSGTFGAGMLEGLEEVVKEFVSARGLAPMRILIVGPTMSGKSTMGLRLSKLYGMQYINAKTIIRSADLEDQEMMRTIQAEMTGKDASRLSDQTMSTLLRTYLENSSSAKLHGFILDNWPKNLPQAKASFQTPIPGMPPTIPADSMATHRGTTFVGKSGQAGTGNVRSSGAGRATILGGKKMGMLDDIPDSMRYETDLHKLPTHVILIEAADEELRGRMKTIATAEVTASTGGAGAGGAGLAEPGKKAKEGKGAGKGTVMNSISGYEKDFQRKYDEYKARVHQDAEELHHKVKEVKQRLGIPIKPTHTAPPPPVTPSTKGAPTPKAKNKVDHDLPAHDHEHEEPEVEIDPALLPKYAGFLGFFAEHGSKILTIQNHQVDAIPRDVTQYILSLPAAEIAARVPSGTGLKKPTMVPGTAPPLLQDLPPQLQWIKKNEVGLAQALQVKLPQVEEQVTRFLGPPHNYEGFPEEGGATADATTNDTGIVRGDTGPHPATPSTTDAPQYESDTGGDDVAFPAAADVAAVDQWQKKLDAIQRRQMRPIKHFLMTSVLPVIAQSLLTIVKEKPEDPVAALAAMLHHEGDIQEAQFSDPYDAPIYKIRAAEILAKQEREEARNAAALAKAEREAAVRALMEETRSNRSQLLTPVSSRPVTPKTP